MVLNQQIKALLYLLFYFGQLNTYIVAQATSTNLSPPSGIRRRRYISRSQQAKQNSYNTKNVLLVTLPARAKGDKYVGKIKKSSEK